MLPVQKEGKSHRKIYCRYGLILLTLFVIALISYFYISEMAQVNEIPTVKLPPGFHINIYLDLKPYDIKPRALALSPAGNIYFSTATQNNIHVFLPNEHTIIPVARQLYCPCSVEMHNGDLFISEQGKVSVIKSVDQYIPSRLFPRTILNDKIPIPVNETGGHNKGKMAIDKDRNVYLNLGVPYNDIHPDWIFRLNDSFGRIIRLKAPDYQTIETYAKGVRNSVGLDFDPIKGGLWFTDNTRNSLGAYCPAEELNHAPTGGFDFGYPYCHGCCVPDPLLNPNGHCPNRSVSPAFNLDPHSAPLGMRFYTGNMFPDFKGDIIACLHGAGWDQVQGTWPPAGYSVIRIKMSGNETEPYRAPYGQEILADFRDKSYEHDWRNRVRNAIPLGRVVDLVTLFDGSILVSDDRRDCLYRIYYRGPKSFVHVVKGKIEELLGWW